MPITGLRSASRAALYIGSAPYMFPWSVMPTAGWPSAATAATTSPTREAPSSIEYSVCRCRWTNESRRHVAGGVGAENAHVEQLRSRPHPRPIRYELARRRQQLAPPARGGVEISKAAVSRHRRRERAELGHVDPRLRLEVDLPVIR